MRVLLISFGSTGDIFPLIAYGRALQAAGHHVRYATSRLYRENILRAGLEFVHLPPDWEREIFIEFMRELNRAVTPLLQLRHIYEGALPFMSELLTTVEEAIADNTDVVVSSYFFPHFGYLAARHQVPFATFAFCHNIVPNDRRPPELFPRPRGWPPPLRRRYNRLCWNIGDRLVDWTLRGVMGDIFRAHDIPLPIKFILEPAEKCLIGVSPAFAEGFECPERFVFTGYLRWQAPENDALQEELDAFCQGEKVPVITFGSVAFDDVHRVMSRFLKHWPRGKKIIIQSGWAGLSVEIVRPEIKLISEVSHDQLFQFASMVIHHGGAGTTASVLAAGVPHIVVPHIADQHWWASEICRKKVGRRLGKRKWPERLPRAVRRIERNPIYRDNAARLGQRIHAEDGPAAAVAELEAYVASQAIPEETPAGLI